jgi:hypothetical protein
MTTLKSYDYGLRPVLRKQNLRQGFSCSDFFESTISADTYKRVRGME